MCPNQLFENVCVLLKVNDEYPKSKRLRGICGEQGWEKLSVEGTGKPAEGNEGEGRWG